MEGKERKIIFKILDLTLELYQSADIIDNQLAQLKTLPISGLYLSRQGF
ncbi:MAG: hypothetical protein V7K30_15995 [Nostoc sp.]